MKEMKEIYHVDSSYDKNFFLLAEDVPIKQWHKFATMEQELMPNAQMKA